MATVKKLLVILLALTPVLGLAQEDKTVKIALDPTIHYQTMDGFGASDAWRCQFVGENWPLEKRERIADLLFSQEADREGNPKGIGLSGGFALTPARPSRGLAGAEINRSR